MPGEDYNPPQYDFIRKKTHQLKANLDTEWQRYKFGTFDTVLANIDGLEKEYKNSLKGKKNAEKTTYSRILRSFLTNDTASPVRIEQIQHIVEVKTRLPGINSVFQQEEAQKILYGAMMHRYYRLKNSVFCGLHTALKNALDFNTKTMDDITRYECEAAYMNQIKDRLETYPYMKSNPDVFTDLCNEVKALRAHVLPQLKAINTANFLQSMAEMTDYLLNEGNKAIVAYIEKLNAFDGETLDEDTSDIGFKELSEERLKMSNPLHVKIMRFLVYAEDKVAIFESEFDSEEEEARSITEYKADLTERLEYNILLALLGSYILCLRRQPEDESLIMLINEAIACQAIRKPSTKIQVDALESLKNLILLTESTKMQLDFKIWGNVNDFLSVLDKELRTLKAVPNKIILDEIESGSENDTAPENDESVTLSYN